MGFFDKMKSMAEKANKFINDDDDDDDDDAPEVRFVAPPKQTGVFSMGSLKTPPAPPVPTSNESMSVRIAVNGKDYGPYERTTLIEMISNGALTPDTLVFMEGMSEWKQAREVAKVAALFGPKVSKPSAPPVPWAKSDPKATQAEAQATQSTRTDNTLSPKLNSLITAAVADGEISDLERQVLIRNAQAENVPMDEFVMVLEARLYEQRQVLKAQQEQREHQAKLVNAQAEASLRSAAPQPAPAAPKANPANSVRKCPACGAIITKTTATCCEECGYEFENVQATSPIQPLIDKLEALDREYQKMNPIKQAMSGAIIYQRKSTAISTYVVPSSRKAIMDFCMIACSSANACQFGDPTKKAWKAKVKEVIERSKTMFPNDAEYMSTLTSTAKTFGIKI